MRRERHGPVRAGQRSAGGARAAANPVSKGASGDRGNLRACLCVSKLPAAALSAPLAQTLWKTEL